MRVRSFCFRLACAGLVLGGAAPAIPRAPQKPPLAFEVFTAGDSGYAVTSTIIYGPKEALLVDAQFTHADARLLADRIDRLGRKLTTIFITHPDADHFLGLGPLHERFPDARIYMTAGSIAAYRQDVGKLIADLQKGKRANEAPPVEPLASPLPSMTLLVDGQRVQVIPDLQGDYHGKPLNSVVWLPSRRTLIAGDMAFDQVHLWLDKSTPDSRRKWRSDLQRLQHLGAKNVIAGHRRDSAEALSPAILATDRAYLARFDSAVASANTATGIERAVTAAYPGWAHALFLKIAARSIYPPAKSPS